MILRGRLEFLRLTAQAGSLRIACTYFDTNAEINPHRIGTPLLASLDYAGTFDLVYGDIRTERTVSLVVIANVGSSANVCSVDRIENGKAVPVWARTLAPGEKAVFTDVSGWVLIGSDGVPMGSGASKGWSLLLKGAAMRLNMVTGTAGDIRASFSYSDGNDDLVEYRVQNGGNLPPITSAGSTLLVPGAARTTRTIGQLTFSNDGAASVACSVQVTDGVRSVPLWERDMLPGEKCEYNDVNGWVVYSDGAKVGTGGVSNGIDTTARAMANAVNNRLNQIYPEAGQQVSPGSTVSIATTDGGIVEVKNPTANPVTIPANPTVADLTAAGLVKQTINPPKPLYHEETATADGKQTIVLAKFDPNAQVRAFINGLEQIENTYTVTATGVELPAGLSAKKGDVITIVYFSL